MMSRRADTKVTLRPNIQQTVEDILDRLPVTDRVYHHLDFSKPLVIELATRLVASHSPPGRVLVIGPDTLLAQLLVRLGYRLDLWQFLEGHLTDDLQPYIREMVTLEQLARSDLPLPEEPYDAVIVPLVLESLPDDPRPFLGALRRAVKPNGSIIVATTNVNRLDLRLRALTGQSMASAYPSFHVSLSFPPLPRRRYFHHDDLLSLSKDAGLWALESAYVIAQAACSTIDPYPPGRYAMLQAGQGMMHLMPSTRHAILLHLKPRVGDRTVTERVGSSDGAEKVDPYVSVALAIRYGGEAFRSALTALLKQDYPADRYEVLVLHDATSREDRAILHEVASAASVPVREIIVSPPEGPAARNAALQAAEGEFCAHTDDACRLPLGWVRAIAYAFDDAIGVLTGPVIETAGSHPDFLVLPGTRLGWDPQEIYPIFNVAFRRQAAIAAGGFDQVLNGQPSLPFGWDADLAWRLQRQGWNGRFLKDMFLYRTYRPPKRLAWIKEEWRLARSLPWAIVRTPELQRRVLKAGRFAGTRTLVFDLLLLGILTALVRRRWKYLGLGLPWLAYYSKFVDIWPVTQWPPSARRLSAIGARHVIWLAGLIAGSIRSRRITL